MASSCRWVLVVLMACGDGAPPAAVDSGEVGEAELALSPTSLDFSSVPLGATSAALRVTVANQGDGAADAFTPTITGDFAIAANDCAALAAGASCAIDVTFAPTVLGQRTGALTVEGLTAQLAGVGAVRLELTPSAHDFNAGSLLTPSGSVTTQTFTLTNAADQSVVLGSTAWALTGTCTQPSATPTSVDCATTLEVAADTCSGQTLAVGASCTLDVTFSPTVQISNAAVLTLTSADTLAAASATIAGESINRAPTNVLLSAASVAENQAAGAAVGTLAAVDPDIGQTFSYAIVPGGDSAKFALSGASLVTTGVLDFELAASLQLTVRVTDQDGGTFDKLLAIGVTDVDDAPVAVADTATVVEDTLTAIPVLANDTDQDGGPKTILAVTQSARGGVVAITGGGTGLTYLPALNLCTSNPLSLHTSDTFTYTLAPASTATVTVSITCVDDDPVAVADAVTVVEDTPLQFTPTTNDTDIDCLPINGGECGDRIVVAFTPPMHGLLSLAGTTFTYTPDPNYCSIAPDTFTYRLNGGSSTSVALTITCVNDPPTFTKGSDVTSNEDAGAQLLSEWATNITGGPVDEAQAVTFTITANSNPSLFAVAPAIAPNGTLTYRAAANLHGSATLTAIATDADGATSAPQTFTITVASVNDAPTVTSTAPVPRVGVPISELLGFSPGPANEATQTAISYSVAVSAATASRVSGTPTISSTGVLTFTPSSAGNIDMLVTVRDSGGTANGGVDTATVTLRYVAIKADQLIVFTTAAPTSAMVGASYNPAATATSGLAVTINTQTPTVCSRTPTQVSFIGTGICLLAGSQIGDGGYNAAPVRIQAIGVGMTAQTVTFTSAAPTAAAVGGTYTPTATASSGGTVQMFSDAPTVCTVTGGVVTFRAAGSCVVAAEQHGMGAFGPARATQTFTVAP